MRCIPPILLVLMACSGTAEAPREVALTTDNWAPTAPAPDEPYLPGEPIDPRRITMAPERHLDQERLCNLSFVGRLHELRPGSNYPLPVSHRTSIRCQSMDGGEGWADLVFPKTSASLASYVEAGEQIRIRVVGTGGFEDHPIVAFVANIGEVPIQPSRWEYQMVGTGDRFDEGWERGACAVLHQGAIRPVTDAYPDNTSHHAILTCRHDGGERLLDVVYPRETQLAALRVRRGEVIPVSRHPEPGEAGLPIALYEGP